MATRKTVELFYDVLSPYSWIAFEVLLRYRPVWNINLNLQPFLLAGVMKATGNSPPGMIPAKGKYLVKDIKRITDLYKLEDIYYPTDTMEVLMKGSLSAMRLLTATKTSQSDKLQENISREIWRKLYNLDEDITEPASLLEVCKRAGLSVDKSQKLLEEAQTDTVKNKLKETTQIAIEHGSFGAPTMLVDNGDGKKEMFFGSDRFMFIAHHLGVEWLGPLNPNTGSKV